MWWKKHKGKIIAPALLAVVLAAAFYGLGGPRSQGEEAAGGGAYGSWPPAGPTDTTQTEPSRPVLSAAEESGVPAGTPSETPAPAITDEPSAGGEESAPPAPAQDEPLPIEPQDMTIGSSTYTCTISIRCDTVLENMDLCDPDKVELIPAEGWILEPTAVTFYEGESVFHVLQRVCKQKKIHMEYENTPLYNSAYIEGINNLYEFDVGAQSGWMYTVNGWFPNYGCSRYQLQDGDVVCWLYTCDLGRDIGGGNAEGSW